MSWRRLAVKDVRDSRREWTLYWVTVGCLLLGLVLSILWGSVTAGGTTGFTSILTVVSLFAIPTILLVTSHEQISRERATGRIRTTLTLPYTRRELLVGVFIGRVILGLCCVTTLVVGALIGSLATGISLTGPEILAYWVATVMLGVTFSGIAISWSAVTTSTTKSLIGCLVTYGTALFWPISLEYLWALTGTNTVPDWLVKLGGIDPVRAYLDAAQVTAAGAITTPGELD